MAADGVGRGKAASRQSRRRDGCVTVVASVVLLGSLTFSQSHMLQTTAFVAPPVFPGIHGEASVRSREFADDIGRESFPSMERNNKESASVAGPDAVEFR